MLVYGYKGNVDWSKVKASLKKCTNLSASDIDKLVRTIKSGQTQTLPDDFVLHDELKDLNILVK